MLWILWVYEIDDAGTVVGKNQSHANIYVQDSLEYARLALKLDTADTSKLPVQDLEYLPCPVQTMLFFRDASQVLANAFDVSCFPMSIPEKVQILM